MGNVHVKGILTKGGGSFLIDHLIDPENKVLRHSFVESPDMMNMYKGRAKLKDGNPDQEFSWVIYADMNDEYAKKHPIFAEEEKGVNNTFKKGEYLHSDVFDK